MDHIKGFVCITKERDQNNHILQRLFGKNRGKEKYEDLEACYAPQLYEHLEMALAGGRALKKTKKFEKVELGILELMLAMNTSSDIRELEKIQKPLILRAQKIIGDKYYDETRFIGPAVAGKPPIYLAPKHSAGMYLGYNGLQPFKNYKEMYKELEKIRKEYERRIMPATFKLTRIKV